MSKDAENKDIIITDKQNEEVGLLANVLINKINQKKDYIDKESKHIEMIELAKTGLDVIGIYVLTSETEIAKVDIKIANKEKEFKALNEQITELEELYKLINEDTEKALLISHAVNLIGG